MGATTNYNLPYPVATDQPFVHTDLKELADGVDAALSREFLSDVFVLDSNWNLAEAYGKPEAKIENDVVHLTGFWVYPKNNVSVSAGTGVGIGTLAAPYRPSATRYLGVGSFGVQGVYNSTFLQLLPSGVIQFVSTLTGTAQPGGTISNHVGIPSTTYLR